MTTQLSQSGRVVTEVAVSAGNVKYCRAGDTSWSTPTNSSGTTPALDATRLNFGADLNGKLWLTDGLVYRVFDPTTTTVSAWTASAGSIPVDGSANTARLIESWRGCIFLSGVIGDPYNWFISKAGDPTNWDTAPVSPGPADAITGTSAPQGKIGDMVTGFVPYTDDIGFLGCTHSLYLFNGHPGAGGQIDLISSTIGMAWGRAWTKDPYGTLYFFSNRNGVYTITPGGQPQRISQQIDNLLTNINSGANTISMAWDDRQQGVHVWITATAAAAAATHYFYEQRTGGWFQDFYSNPSHNPLCACQFDGNNPEDRVVLMGSWDGVCRFLDLNAATDDQRLIQSSVIIGPILTENLDEMMMKEIQGVLGADSGPVNYSIMAGATAEAALLNTPRLTGTFLPGRSSTQAVRVADHVIYLGLSAKTPWRAEQFRALIATKGKIRRRSTY